MTRDQTNHRDANAPMPEDSTVINSLFPSIDFGPKVSLHSKISLRDISIGHKGYYLGKVRYARTEMQLILAAWNRFGDGRIDCDLLGKDLKRSPTSVRSSMSNVPLARRYGRNFHKLHPSIVHHLKVAQDLKEILRKRSESEDNTPDLSKVKLSLRDFETFPGIDKYKIGKLFLTADELKVCLFLWELYNDKNREDRAAHYKEIAGAGCASDSKVENFYAFMYRMSSSLVYGVSQGYFVIGDKVRVEFEKVCKEKLDKV